ncbi:hypothetical protein ABH963_000062 [Bacillus sp. RC55]|uniref:hypothetical protein n=1 Tax=Bacillus sp. RC55 TaxID=3156292 RepID=UPI0038362D1B
MENTIHELVMKVQLKSGRAVMLYEDVTENVKDGMTQDVLFGELRKGEMENEVVGQTQTGNIVMIPTGAIDYIEVNIQERLKEA